MQESAEVIEICQACGAEMDVTAVGPYTNVGCPVCGEHNRVKRVLGPYFLERRHSYGGMSTVFVALDQKLNREVALKILNEQWCTDEKRIAAFVEEAQLTASLSHPNIVRVFRTGWEYGRFYIAMELVPGAHLEHWIRERGRIPEDEVLSMAIQVAHGLKAAQAAGLIHRDMKPGNILLDDEGKAKIVDFGLALVTQAGSVTAQELWATPYYVPPEAVDGKPESFKSDMYAFGATLYHALAGFPPCAEESMATDKLREAKKHIKLLQRECPDISAPTCKAVTRAMAYEPEGRFNSYDEMIAAFENARKELVAPIQQKQKSSFPMILAASLALVALVGAVGWKMTHRPKSVAPPAISDLSDEESVSTDPPVAPLATPEEVMKRYEDAKKALFAADYEKARRYFAGLRDDPHTQEPTATWSGVEAVIAAGLAGDITVARSQAAKTREHIESRKVSDPTVNENLLPLLKLFGGMPPIGAKRLPEKMETDSDLLAALLCGIKNWEQGSLKEADKFFAAVAQASGVGSDDWGRFYKQMAAKYVADYQILTDPVFADYPATPEECRKSMAQLEALLPKLQTNGRARFNIRAWQLDLARHAKLLKAKDEKVKQVAAVPDSQDTPAVLMEKILRWGDIYSFSQAETYLQRQPVTPLSVVFLDGVSSAKQLLEELTEDLKKTPALMPLELRSGVKITKLSANDADELIGVNESGKTVSVQWLELTPDSVIALHRNSVKSITNDQDIARRHSNAIFFDWLSGNKTRSANAADRFSESNPDFKRRWKAFTDALP